MYQTSLHFAAWAYRLARRLRGRDRHARDQLLRASQSITLNIAEACGRSPAAERSRFLRIAAGSTRECGAVVDILARCAILQESEARVGKRMLVRIASMLHRLNERAD